jgi:drug/metabolite transporter (DMT)-like permease
MEIVGAAATDYYVGTVNLFDRLSPSHWWVDPTEPLDNPIYLVMAAALGLALVVAAFAWIAVPRLFADHRFRQRQVTRLAVTVFTFSAVGLLLLLFRWQAVPFFSKRLWLYLWWLAAIGTVGYIAYYLKRVYPSRLAAWEDAERRRRYLPKPGSSRQRSRQRSRRRR